MGLYCLNCTFSFLAIGATESDAIQNDSRDHQSYRWDQGGDWPSRSWDISLIEYDPEFFDQDEGRVEPTAKPFIPLTETL